MSVLVNTQQVHLVFDNLKRLLLLLYLVRDGKTEAPVPSHESCNWWEMLVWGSKGLGFLCLPPTIRPAQRRVPKS